ncbi:MAG: hypothetical protein IIC01_08375 [Planctomycetes bacterium]|nr:hypothetical protein [Planctomycetota bacterium]
MDQKAEIRVRTGSKSGIQTRARIALLMMGCSLAIGGCDPVVKGVSEGIANGVAVVIEDLIASLSPGGG